MGLIRVLVFGLAIWLLYKFYTIYKARLAAMDSQEVKGGNMVKCSECGAYTPESKSIESGAHHFCCESHQRAFEDKSKP